MSPLAVLVIVILVAAGVGAYALLLGDDRRQRRIESERTDALEHIAAPGVIDRDPTHFDRGQSRRR